MPQSSKETVDRDGVQVTDKAQAVQCEDEEFGAIEGVTGPNMYQYVITLAIPLDARHWD